MVAFALAIALHELAAAFAHFGAPQAQDRERVQVAYIARIEHRPSPTPKPTPRPTPTPNVRITPVVISTPHYVISRIENPAPAAPKRAALTEGAAKSVAHTIHHAPRIEHIAVPRIAHGGPGLGHRGAATGAGGTSQGTGSGAGGQGNGTGSGGTGTGSGTYAAADEPCGYVEFVPNAEPIYDKNTGSFKETIRMTVHFPDGHAEFMRLDWLWYYPSESVDPWSAQNERLHPDAPIPFQPPPADKLANEPSLVQYVVKHSTPDGYTLLKDCPPNR